MYAQLFRRVFSSFLLMVCGAACVAAPTPTPTPLPDLNTVLTVKDGGDERLRALALRMIAPYTSYVASGGSAQTPEIIVGGLPDNFPLELPQPPNSTLLGSARGRVAWDGVQVFLDVNDSLAGVIDFYTQQLKDQGFTVWTPVPPIGKMESGTDGVVLCRADKPTEVDIFAAEMPNKPLQVTLTVETSPQLTRCLWDQPDRTISYSEKMMPSLQPPENALTTLNLNVHSNGGGSAYSTGTASESLALYTDLSVAQVAESYAKQLVDAGWTKADETNTNQVAWSRWTKHDEFDSEWSGVLIITAGAVEERERFMIFNIELK